eukprot:scaffold4484_cov98-Isochrysis_galbana.AAC.7
MRRPVSLDCWFFLFVTPVLSHVPASHYFTREIKQLQTVLTAHTTSNGGSTTAVLGTLRALGNVRALVFGQYGEASADVHSLLRAAAKSAAASAGRQSGAPSGALSRLTALFE